MRPSDAYGAFLLDLDGVVYRGDQAVPGAPQALAALRRAGRRLVFLTNNSARTPREVADKLAAMGMQASPGEVLTSAQAAAALVARAAREDGRPTTAFVVGERGVREALAEAGIEVLDGDPLEAGFVVVGWDRSADYDRLRTASVLARRGARLVATNADPSYPAPGGELWPGAGALLAAVETASSVRAEVVGKPHRAMFQAAVDRAASRETLMVGDRIETDVAGALAAGLDAALVTTGAHGPADLLDQDALPTMILNDLGGLVADRPAAFVRAAEAGDLDTARALARGAGLAAEDVAAGDTAVAEDGGTLLGAASAAVRGHEMYVHSVAVREEARGHHVGTLVVAAAVRGAAARGGRTAYLLTEDAHSFFARLGFEGLGREELPPWVVDRSVACSASAVAMRRKVSPPQ